VQEYLDTIEKNEFGRMSQFRIDTPKIKRRMVLIGKGVEEESEELPNSDEEINSESFINGSI
jgi:hypothetical protein